MRKKPSKNTSLKEIEHQLLKCNAGIVKHTELLIMYGNMKDKAIKQITDYIFLKVQLKGILRMKANKSLRSRKTTDRLMKL